MMDYYCLMQPNHYMGFRVGNASKMILTASGNLGIGIHRVIDITEKLHVKGNILAIGDMMAEDFICTTDKRLKNNISNYSRGLKEVLQLNPINFTYNGKAGITSKDKKIGLGAQDLQKLVPEMVKEFTYQEVDTDDKVISQENYLQIVESDIKYLLINAIKEQQKIIENLEAKIDQYIANVDLDENNQENDIRI